MSAPPASAPPALAVERLNAWYGAAQVLYDVAFTVGAARWWR
jgi:ABC-type branched-subunit amino acid transport system ATPase component